MNREEYLNRLIDALKPLFQEHGAVIPAVKVSCGFPSKSALSRKRKRIGECWHGDSTACGGTAQIFISPVLGHSDIGHVLIHELCHAVLPKGTKHNKTFAKLVKALGLEGKPTATIPSSELTSRLNMLQAELGDYPHEALMASEPEKKQTTRLLKAMCSCERIMRITQSAWDGGAITCNACEEPFQLA